MKENKQKKIKLKKKKLLLKYKKKKETLKEEEKKPTVHQSKKKSLKLRLMSSRKCPHENAIEVCVCCVWRHICLQKLLWNIFQNKGYKDIHQETYYIIYSEKPSSWPICFIQKLSTLGLLYYLAYGLKNKVCSNSVYCRRW